MKIILIFTFKKINKWSIPNAIDREQIDIALTLKGCKDFILHSLCRVIL